MSGALLGLITFLQPAATELAEGGIAELRRYTPGQFWWWLCVPGYVLMAAGLGMTLRAAKTANQPAAENR